MEDAVSAGAAWARFSTADVPEPDRLERWEEYTTDTVAPMSCRTLRPDFHACLVHANIGAIDVLRTTGTSHIVERSARLVRLRPADCVGVHVILRGQSVLYSGEEIIPLRPGQILVHDSDQPLLIGHTDGLDNVSLRVPNSVYAELSHGAPTPRPRVADLAGPSGAYVSALRRLLDRATRRETAVKPDEEAVLGLLSAIVTDRRPSTSADAHYAAARDVIEHNLGNPALSASFVADRIGISGRHLSRVFAAQETTVPQVIRGLRLERAHRMLTTVDRGETRTVAEVARRCGFLSATHFSDSFLRRFGIRPADVGRQARGATAVAG